MPVFEFISSEDPAARTRVKSYAARKANRERRLREIKAYQLRVQSAHKPLQHRDHSSTSIPDAPQLDQPIGQQLGQRPILPRPAEPEIALTSLNHETSSKDDATIKTYSDEQITDPLTWVDTYASRVAARPRDSFWTGYSQLNVGDRNLLQWCESTLSLSIRPC
jgi:hypothetical protein